MTIDVAPSQLPFPACSSQYHPFFSHLLWSTLQAIGLLFCLLWYYYIGKFFYMDNNGRNGSFVKRSNILPPYVLFFKFNFAIAIITIVVLVAEPNLPLTKSKRYGGGIYKSLIVGIIWGIWHMFIDGVAIMLLQKGIGLKSYLAGIKYTTLFSLVTVICIAMSRLHSGSKSQGTITDNIPAILWNIIMFTFYSFIAFAPSACLFRRTAVYIYARFWVVVRFGGLIASIMSLLDSPVASCIHFTFETVIFTIFQPYILYQTFAKDSSYWRGEDILRAVRHSKRYQRRKKLSKINSSNNEPRSTSFETRSALHSPLLGIEIDTESTDIILEQVDTLANANQEFLIDFRDLALQESCIVGVGGSARVYKGKYKNENVAVKLLYCIEITRTVVEDFFCESKVLMNLCDSHPNIIEIKGVCVAPPALGIVLELCDESLFGKLSRQSKTSISEFLKLAIDCTRALKYLHDRQPSLCHRDVKSLNFLMKNNVVKLADMGLTRSTIALGNNNKAKARQNYGSLNYTNIDNNDPIVGTLQWAAPEVIMKQEYTEHSDIYSLGIVLWEILTGNSPYDDIRFNSEIEKFVLSGGRPIIPEGTNIKIKALLEKTWCAKPEERISANEIINILKSLMENEEDLLHVKKYDIIAAIADPLNKLILNRYYYGAQYRNCFIGNAVLKFLVEQDMIESKEEGIDILNMLVRDGKITHVKNEHEFKDEYLFYVFS